MIWLNCMSVEEFASDLAELPVPVILWNCLWSVDSVSVIWQNCLLWRKVPVIWQNKVWCQ